MKHETLFSIRSICLRIGLVATAVVALSAVCSVRSVTSLCRAATFEGNGAGKRLAVLAGDRHQPSSATRENVLDAGGVIETDEARHLNVHSMLAGRVSCDRAVVGQFYHKGQLLATIESPALVIMRARYVTKMEENEFEIRKTESKSRLAQTELRRVRQLVTDGIAARKDLRKAEEELLTLEEHLHDLREIRVNNYNEAKALLEIYGVKVPQVDCRELNKEVPLRAPGDGILLKERITLGDHILPSELACVLVDVRKIGLKLHLSRSQYQCVSVGQRVIFVSDSVAGVSFPGEVKCTMDRPTSGQEFLVLAELENPRMLLRPAMTGRVKIFLEPSSGVRAKMAGLKAPQY